MNIWNIALKRIKSTMRSKMTFWLMLALPIVMMLILGTALSNAFTDGSKIGDMKLLISNEWTNQQITPYWNGFVEAIEKQGVQVTQAEAGMDSKEEVRSDRYTAYAELRDDGIKFYGSSKRTIESNILQGMLTTFADRYSLTAAAYEANPSAVQEIVASAMQSGDYIRETSLDHDKLPGSMDYYAVAMSTMIAFYSIILGSYLYQTEKLRNTYARLMASPVSKIEFFAGSIIGATFINLLCVLVVVLFSKFVFHAEWGSHYGIVLLVLLTEVLLAVSMGVGISFIFKNESSRMVVMLFTQVASFLGGAYFPISDGEGIMDILANLSPIRWANSSLTKLIYADDVAAAWSTIGLNVGIAAIFLIFAIFCIRKQEAV
ncbi:ABC transporter permease [Paenibacillus albiflavus]|uniref:ABC transporter permease n=1 Tax=Paenibacillus albiflavus TaxID=2545760 RepID=A0A4R4ECC0_9BACL|nr:ABC transporter permease [Paenibacillus albiflavus]TCZ76620.1 ABC transporter permease [Paenibacillus albiflavus]